MTDWDDVAAVGLVISLIGLLGVMVHLAIILVATVGFPEMYLLLVGAGGIVILTAIIMERRKRR